MWIPVLYPRPDPPPSVDEAPPLESLVKCGLSHESVSLPENNA